MKAFELLQSGLWAPVLKGLARPGWLEKKGARLVGFARARVLFRGAELGVHVCALGRVQVDVHGRLVLGDRVTFVGGMLPTRLTVRAGALLEVGAETSINYGATFEAHQQVKVGRRCLFASMTHLGDRLGQRVAPIVIGDDCWVAHGAVIEPGVTVGDGSVVAAGAVVTKDVPEHSLALGNPARSMKLSTVA